MDFLLYKGRNFTEHFDFKTKDQKPKALPNGVYRVVVERGSFAREYTVGEGLTRQRTTLIWKISAEETLDFEYTTMYYTLYLDDTELARGVLKIQ